MLCSEAAESSGKEALGMAYFHVSLEGCGCHLAFWGFCLCENSKIRLALSLFAPFQKGLKNVFDEAILAALEPPEPKKTRRCVLLWTSLHSPFCKAGVWCHTKSNVKIKLKIQILKFVFAIMTNALHSHLPHTIPVWDENVSVYSPVPSQFS